MEPLDYPGRERSDVDLSDLVNPKRIGTDIQMSILPFFLFQNMSPRSSIPKSSKCMAIFIAYL